MEIKNNKVSGNLYEVSVLFFSRTFFL